MNLQNYILISWGCFKLLEFCMSLLQNKSITEGNVVNLNQRTHYLKQAQWRAQVNKVNMKLILKYVGLHLLSGGLKKPQRTLCTFGVKFLQRSKKKSKVI